MLWIATISAQLFCGIQFISYILKDKVDFLVSLSSAVPIGFSLSSLLFFLCSAFLGFNALHLIIHTVSLFCIGLLLFFSGRKSISFSRPPLSDIVFLAFSLGLSFYIVLPMYIPAPASFHKVLKNTFLEEFSLANSFYQGVNGGMVNLFKIRHPSCYRCYARSRWLTALHSAMMLTGAASYRQSFVVPSFLMVGSLCFLFLRLADVYLRNVIVSMASLVLFLFAGGFGFLDYFETVGRSDPELDFVFNSGGHVTEWSHPLLHYLFAHRPSQLSLGLVISAFLVVSRSFGRRELAFVGITLGILPAVQHQAFICGLIWFAIFIALHYRKTKKKWKEIAMELATLVVFFALVATAPLVHYLPRQNRTPMAISARFWQPLTSRGAFFPLITLWWDALGAFSVVTILIAWIAMDAKMFKLYLPSFAVFLVANYVQFEGYSRMNVVAFYPYWMSVGSIVFFSFFRTLARRFGTDELRGIVVGVACVLFCCSIASALLGFYHLRVSKALMWTPDTERVVRWIADHTPRKAVFISPGVDFDPIPHLAGKVSYVHTDLTAWTHGFTVEGRDAEINAFLKNSNSPTLCPKVQYVINTGTGRQLEDWGRGNWTKVFSFGQYTVLKRGT
jgi:hypothetical protein